jgi:hypothetical protein
MLEFLRLFIRLLASPFRTQAQIRARHRTVDGHRPEPAQIVETAAGLVDAADLPLAGKDGVVRPVLVDAGAEAGRAELEGHTALDFGGGSQRS